MTMTRVRRTLAWLVGAYLAYLFVTMGWVKFDPDGFWTAPFERWGYPVWLRLLVGVLEVGGGLLLLVPRTARYGAALLVPVMLGALYTRVGDGRLVDAAWISAYLAALAWIAWEFRHARWPGAAGRPTVGPDGDVPQRP